MARRRRSSLGGSSLTIGEVKKAVSRQKFIAFAFPSLVFLWMVIFAIAGSTPPGTDPPAFVGVLALAALLVGFSIFVTTIMWASALRNLGCSFALIFIPLGYFIYWWILYDRTQVEAKKHGLQVGLFGLSGRSLAELEGRSRGSRSRGKGSSLGRKSKSTKSLGRKSKGTKSLGRKSKGSKLGQSKTRKRKTREPTPEPEPESEDLEPAEDEIEVECPGCGEVLFVPEDVLGKTLRCGACKETFEVE